MVIGEGVVGITGGTAALQPRRGSQSGAVGRETASADGDREVAWLESVLKLVVRGSDPLVEALYQRIRTDRAGGSALTRVDRAAKSWPELAELAVAERTLTRSEAQHLLRSLFHYPAA